MGFCRRCGDIIRSDERCAKCGGTNVASQASRALFEKKSGETKPADRWLKTYGRRSASPSALAHRQRAYATASTHSTAKSASSSAIAPTTTRRVDSPLRNVENVDPTPATPSTPSNQTPYHLRRGRSVKASAQAHVRALTSNMADDVELSAAEEEVLSNVFGSVLDPHETRGKCGLCKEMFRRDIKIYPDPRRDQGNGFEGVFYCRTCYAREFAKGMCHGCNKVVIGDEPFVSLGRAGTRGLWHKQCFRCAHCGRDTSANPSVDLTGSPCCEDCFEQPASGITNSVTDIPDLRVGVRPTSKPSKDAVALKPAIDELHKRLRSAGLATDTQPEAKKRGLSTPPTIVQTTIPDESVAPLRFRKSSAPPSVTQPRLPTTSSTLPTHASAPPPHALSPMANPTCYECKLSLFRTRALGGGSVGDLVTLPTSDRSYHKECLRCDHCRGPFSDGKYIEDDGKTICVSCIEDAEKKLMDQQRRQQQRRADVATPAVVPWVKSLSSTEVCGPSPNDVDCSFPTPTSPRLRGVVSPRIAQSPFFTSSSPTLVNSGVSSCKKFGGQHICPGCRESGTVSETKLGPSGERWHSRCLKCQCCNKSLDSGAKKNRKGLISCRNCLDVEAATLRSITVPSPLIRSTPRLATLA